VAVLARFHIWISEILRKSGAVPKSCLIVEDDAFEMRQLQRLVRAMNRRLVLVSVCSIREAKVHLRRTRFDLILLDNVLPDGYGIELAMELSHSQRHCMTPMAIVSEWPTPFIFEKAKRANAIKVLRKKYLTPSKIENIMDRTFRKTA